MAAIKCPECGSDDLYFEVVTCQAEEGNQWANGDVTIEREKAIGTIVFAVCLVECAGCSAPRPELRQAIAEKLEVQWKETCDEVFAAGMVLLPRIEKALREATSQEGT